MDKPNVINPETGVVHKVAKWKDGIICNSETYTKGWRRTNAPITCKNCIRQMTEEVEVSNLVSCNECALLHDDYCMDVSNPGEKCCGHLPKDWRNMRYQDGKWYKRVKK